jgi:hypothetical protein
MNRSVILKTTTIRDENFNDHNIRVDEMIEHDTDGNPTVVKNICLVDKPNNETVIFNVSPYTHADSIIGYAKEWIGFGCPENKDQFGIPQKWDADSLRTLRPLSGN